MTQIKRAAGQGGRVGFRCCIGLGAADCRDAFGEILSGRRYDYEDHHHPIWLHCVLYEATLARRRTGHVRFERAELTASHPLSGNIVVRDLDVDGSMVSRLLAHETLLLFANSG